eukprot:2150807-Rhodomonas_salina.3
MLCEYRTSTRYRSTGQWAVTFIKSCNVCLRTRLCTPAIRYLSTPHRGAAYAISVLHITWQYRIPAGAYGGTTIHYLSTGQGVGYGQGDWG